MSTAGDETGKKRRRSPDDEGDSRCEPAMDTTTKDTDSSATDGYPQPSQRALKMTWFAILSLDMLIEVLELVDFRTQQKVKRVCRYWKDVVSRSMATKHAYLDTNSFLNKEKFVAELNRTDPGRFIAHDVLTLIFDGLYHKRKEIDGEAARIVRRFADRCPNLNSLIVRRLSLHTIDDWQTYFEQAFYPVTIAESEMIAGTLKLPGNPVKIELSCPIAHLAIQVGDNMWKVLKDYLNPPSVEEQLIAWLAKCAAVLSGDHAWKQWLQTDGFLPEGRAEGQVGVPRWDVTRPEEALRSIGYFRLLKLAAYVRTRSDVQFPPPPFKLAFESEKFRKQAGIAGAI